MKSLESGWELDDDQEPLSLYDPDVEWGALVMVACLVLGALVVVGLLIGKAVS